MKQPLILVVGNTFTSLSRYLVGHDFDYIVLKDRHLTKFPDKKFKRRVVCDFSDLASVMSVVDDIQAKRPIDGVISVYEQFVEPAAQLARHLGLPALPEAAAAACTDKFIMRSRFRAAPEQISPDFAVVQSEQDLRDFAARHDFPLILKPANLSKSLLVSKNDSLPALLESYRKAIQNIDRVYQKYAPHTTPKLLVEEFMQGTVHSVDAFVDGAGKPFVLDAIVDYETGNDIGFDDNFHYSRLLPSQLSDDEKAAIKHVASLGITALGIKNSPAHVEIIMTHEGPRIVEIGARNGGYRERMHMLANGIDIFGNALRLSMRQQPLITSDRNESVGVFELFPKEPGEYVGLAHEEELRALDSLAYISIKAKPGTYVGKASDGYKMCAIVTLHNADQQQFAKDLAFLNQKVSVLTKV